MGLIISLLSFFNLFNTELLAQNFQTNLLSISYYSDGGCSKNAPILVRIKFKVDNMPLKDLKLVARYDSDITYTVPVKEVDNYNNIYYSFCARDGEAINFKVHFINSKGETSNVVQINLVPGVNNISDASPPQLKQLGTK